MKYLKIIFGNILITGSYAFITVPNHIINGGVTSFSLVLSNWINVNIAILTNLFTILLLGICYVFLGKKYFSSSIFSCLCYMTFFDLFHSMNIKLNMPIILCVIISGVLVGIGYFLCLSAKSTTVGFDVVALILNNKNERINVAFSMGIINSIVLSSGIFTYGLLSIIYGFIFTFLQSSTLNFCLKKSKSK